MEPITLSASQSMEMISAGVRVLPGVQRSVPSWERMVSEKGFIAPSRS